MDDCLCNKSLRGQPSRRYPRDKFASIQRPVTILPSQTVTGHCPLATLSRGHICKLKIGRGMYQTVMMKAARCQNWKELRIAQGNRVATLARNHLESRFNHSSLMVGAIYNGWTWSKKYNNGKKCVVQVWMEKDCHLDGHGLQPANGTRISKSQFLEITIPPLIFYNRGDLQWKYWEQNHHGKKMSNRSTDQITTWILASGVHETFAPPITVEGNIRGPFYDSI
jgi:hypothetical protein